MAALARAASREGQGFGDGLLAAQALFGASEIRRISEVPPVHEESTGMSVRREVDRLSSAGRTAARLLGREQAFTTAENQGVTRPVSPALATLQRLFR